MIYIKEAHPSDGWASRANERAGIEIRSHRDYDERVQACTAATSQLKIKIPAIVDGMDDKVNQAYSGSPDRLYLIGQDGRILLKGDRGPRGFAPSVETLARRLETMFGDSDAQRSEQK